MWVLVLSCVLCHVASAQQCRGHAVIPDYSNVLAGAKETHAAFSELPGFTRSVYHANYALITPESRVWTGMPGWTNARVAHLISKASGAHFSMYFADMKKGGSRAPSVACDDRWECVASSEALFMLERFVLVLEGALEVSGCANKGGEAIRLAANHYAFMPACLPSGQHNGSDAPWTPGCAGQSSMNALEDTSLLVFERLYTYTDPTADTAFLKGYIEESPLLDTGAEMFALRKLLPQALAYDFNVHVMDFQPGEHLVVKEVHYNQHGLLLLQGKGIYRLADSWFPVQAGDAIYMAPFVPQWFAALGTSPARYIIYKDVHNDPLLDH